MDEGEPRPRHRGFFLHSDTTGEPDTTEQENPEGFTVRFRTRRGRRRLSSMMARGSAARSSAGRAHTNIRLSENSSTDEGLPQIRSGSVTGSRQRPHLSR
jgi:hypothetical protein